MPALSPLAPAHFPVLPPIAGVRLAAYEAGVRYRGRNDLMVAELVPGTTIAGVFTRSVTPGQPILWCRECLPGGKARAIVVNSGNANVFTGRAGREVVESTAATAAGLFNCDPKEVFISSTGVIGDTPPADRISGALPHVVPLLAAEAWEPAARAIMTTDTFPKGATATAMIDGVEVRLNGFAKGSGMIAPDMATMLAYVFTDAALVGKPQLPPNEFLNVTAGLKAWTGACVIFQLFSNDLISAEYRALLTLLRDGVQLKPVSPLR